MKRFSSGLRAAALLALAGTPAALAEDNLSVLGDSNPMAWWENLYSPARTAIMNGTNSVMPFYGYVSHRFPASINRGGKLSATAYGSGVAWDFISKEEKFISVTNFDFRRTDYDFSGTPNALGEPFSHVDSFKFFDWSEYVFDKENGRSLAFLASGALISSDTTATGHGAHGLFGVGLKQYFSRTESICAGLIVSYSRHRERWTLVPMVLFDYSPTRELNLRVGNGVDLTWDVGGKNEWLLRVGVAYSTDCITVGDGECWYTQSAPFALTARRNIGKNFFVTAGLTTILWSDYRYWEGGHKRDAHFTVDPAVQLSIQAGVRF